MRVNQLMGLSALVATGFFGGGMQANASAFEIPKTCEGKVPFTKVVKGQCDDSGLLQGQGTTELVDVYFIGNYKDGLPHGDFELLQRNKPSDPSSLVKKCKVSFVNGQLDNTALYCTYKSSDRFSSVVHKNIELEVIPEVGKLEFGYRDTRREKNAFFITASLPTIKFKKNYYTRGDTPFFEKQTYSLAGKATTFWQFAGSGSDNGADVTEGELSYSNGVVVKGNFRFGGSYCDVVASLDACDVKINTVEDGKLYTNLDKKYLYEYSYTKDGKRHTAQFVLVGRHTLRYYKDDTGLEFDGLTDCVKYGCNAFFQLNEADGSITIKPKTGKVTDPTGRVAYFENGHMVR